MASLPSLLNYLRDGFSGDQSKSSFKQKYIEKRKYHANLLLYLIC